MFKWTEHDDGERPSRVAASERSRPMASSLIAGVTGFVAGAVVWHFIGFWSFVASIVTRGPEPPASTVVAAEPAKMPGAKFRAVGVSRERTDPARCSSVVLDRNTGSVITADCEPSPAFALRASGRKDRVATASPRRWIVEVNADPEH